MNIDDKFENAQDEMEPEDQEETGGEHATGVDDGKTNNILLSEAGKTPMGEEETGFGDFV